MSKNYPIIKSSESQVVKTRRIYRNEEWRTIYNFSNYEVSNYGRVRSFIETGSNKRKEVPQRLIHHVVTHGGYIQVHLWKQGKRYPHKIHRLVLEAFIGDCPDNMECCHNDGDRQNNKLCNLRWDTKSNNQKDRIKHGTSFKGEKHQNSKLTEEDIKKIRQMYPTHTQARLAILFNVGTTTINYVVNRKRWVHI